ncbi:MAG: N-acetyltransferase [Phycisphaerae bacterium]|nr:N-acetyltransferase [Phycisphaerae bacterium]
MDIQLTPITPADGRAVVDLFNHYVLHSFAAFPETPLPEAFFDRLLEATRGLPTVAARDPSGRLLGFALLRPHIPWPTSSHVGEITYFVAPDSTGLGLGSKMLADLETRARAQGIRTILASISSLNEMSLAFHRKHGFEEVGRFRNVVIKRGTPFDAVWMQKNI